MPARTASSAARRKRMSAGGFAALVELV